MKKIFFYIDIAGFCNLRCPSCPSANMPNVTNSKGFMKPELLKKIMGKAVGECKVIGVGLFNWGEPLLHPNLAEMVEIVQSYNVPCSISTNLSYFKNMDKVMKRNPHSIRISNSGFTQKIYGYSHRNGNIKQVKKNMKLIAQLKEKYSADTNISVFYHRYRGNLKDELLMKKYANSLGFEFQPYWALMMPLEKLFAYKKIDMTMTMITKEDKQLIDYLALPLSLALNISKKYTSSNCTLRDNQMTINYDGNVQLCCAIYDSSKFKLGNYLGMSLTKLQKLKYSHNICKLCIKEGLNVYATYEEYDKLNKFNNLAKNNIPSKFHKRLGLKKSILSILNNQIKKVLRKVLSMINININRIK